MIIINKLNIVLFSDKFKDEELPEPPCVHDLVPPKTPVLAVPSFSETLPFVDLPQTSVSMSCWLCFTMD